MEESKFLIITGMSGAGKTQAIRTLEDMNYFCVDNMPPALITKFAELSRQASAPRNTAIVVDKKVQGNQAPPSFGAGQNVKRKYFLRAQQPAKNQRPCNVYYRHY